VSGIDECLFEAMAIPGVLGVSLVGWSSGLVLGALGQGPNGDHEVAAAETTEVARAAVESGSVTTSESGKQPVEDILITLGSQYHLIRLIGGRRARGCSSTWCWTGAAPTSPWPAINSNGSRTNWRSAPRRVGTCVGDRTAGHPHGVPYGPLHRVTT
jgi:hypothetical protein